MELNKIVCGDCVDVMVTFPDKSVDLVVTSPPYGKIRDYENGHVFDFNETAKQLYRIIKDGGIVAWVRNDTVEKGSKSGDTFKQTLKFMESGFLLHDVIIWEKSGTSYPSKGRYTGIHEYIIILSKGKPKTFNVIKDLPKLWEGSWGKLTTRNQDGSLTHRNLDNEGKAKSGRDDTGKYGFKQRTTIWKINNGHGYNTKDKIAKGHPATFPEQLANDVIVSWSSPGDVVLDIMNGSGTVTKVAKSLGRNYIGIDISEEYCKIAEERITYVEHGENMTDYKTNCETGRQGESEVIDFLQSRLPDCEFVQFTSQEDQRFKGDYCMIMPNEKKVLIEIKTEKQNKYKNLFLEWWSNKSNGKVGWMQYSSSEYLFYYFLDTKELFSMKLKKLQEWAKNNIDKYPLKLQTKNEQSNDSWGYCVPIDILRELGTKINFSEYIIIP
jgi:site-specific DNA-methyltransferase (adenine-specific)